MASCRLRRRRRRLRRRRRRRRRQRDISYYRIACAVPPPALRCSHCCKLCSVPANRTVRQCRAQKRCPSPRLSPPPIPPPRFCEGLSLPPVALVPLGSSSLSAHFGPASSLLAPRPSSLLVPRPSLPLWVLGPPIVPLGPLRARLVARRRRFHKVPLGPLQGGLHCFVFLFVPEWRLRAKPLGVQPRDPRGLRGRANAP